MPSIFHSLEVAKRALFTYQQSQNTTAHNIANANTPGYTKQEAISGATPPYTYPGLDRATTPGQVGTGVEIKRIKRYYDEYITTRLREEDRNHQQWEVLYNITREIEGVFNEPQEGEINSLIDKFFASFEELSKQPQNLAVRTNLLQHTKKLTNSVNYAYQRLVGMQLAHNETITLLVKEINSKAEEIANLNNGISAVEGVGNNANDLRDKRDLIISELSQIVNVSWEEWGAGQMAVYIGGKILVQNDRVMKIKVDENFTSPQLLDVKWEKDNYSVDIRGGKLHSYLYARDNIIPYYQEQINQLVRNLMVEVNTLHSSGWGLQDANGDPYTGYNFFEASTLQTRLSNTTSPQYQGIIQGIVQLPEEITTSTTLDNLGISAGTFTVDGKVFNLTAQEVSSGTAITLQTLLNKISASGDISAYYNSENKRIILQKRFVSTLSEANFASGEDTDTSNFLTQQITGLRSASPGNFGAHITIISSDAGARFASAKDIETEIAKIATASVKEGVPGDGSRALLISQLRQNLTTGGIPPTGTYEEFYRGIITQIGLDTQEAERLMENYEMQKQTLENRRQEVSGVSIDEELVKMIKYQQSYNAAARLFTTLNEMLDTIIGLGRR